MKTEFCSNCNRPMKLVQVLNERQAVMKCKHCHSEKVFTYEEDVFPSNINSFNLGAFALWPIWGFGNKMSYTFVLGIFVAFIEILILLFSDYDDDVFFYKASDWSTAENFENIQSMWNVVGVIFIVAIILYIYITLFKVDLLGLF